MALPFHPKAAEIFMCEFPHRDAANMDDVAAGEMVKSRLVIVLNKKLPGRDRLVNVVPISMTPPAVPRPWQILIPNACLPRMAVIASNEPRYAKVDMLCTVSLSRLNFYQGHWNTPGQLRQHRRRVIEKGKLDAATFTAVKLAVATVLDIHGKLFSASPPELESQKILNNISAIQH